MCKGVKLKPNTASKNNELMNLEAVLTKLRRFVIYGLHKFNSDDRTFIKYKNNNNNTHDETDTPYSFRYINIDEYKELMVDYIKSTTVHTSRDYAQRIQNYHYIKTPTGSEYNIIPIYVYELTILIFKHVFYTDDRIYEKSENIDYHKEIKARAKAKLPGIIAKINELTLKLKNYLWTYKSTDYIDRLPFNSRRLNNLHEHKNDFKAKIRQQSMLYKIANNHPLLHVKLVQLSFGMRQKPNYVTWFSNGGWLYYSKYDNDNHPYLNKTGPAKLNYVAKIQHPTNILSINTLDEFIKFTVEYGIAESYMKFIRSHSVYANEADTPTDTPTDTIYANIDWDRVSNTYMGVAFNFHKASYLPGYDNSKHANYVVWYDTGDSYAIESLVIFNTFAFNNTVTLTTFKI